MYARSAARAAMSSGAPDGRRGARVGVDVCTSIHAGCAYPPRFTGAAYFYVVSAVPRPLTSPASFSTSARGRPTSSATAVCAAALGPHRPPGP